MIQGIPGNIDSRVFAGRTTGIKGEKCWGNIIENLHVFSGLAKYPVSPLKCLIENVDKHIKNGVAQIYRKKTPASPVLATTPVTDFRRKATDQADMTGDPDGP